MPATATEMSTSEAARCLGVASETLRTWVRAGKIAARESPLGLIFDAQVVHDLAAKRERQAREKATTRPEGRYENR